MPVTKFVKTTHFPIEDQLNFIMELKKKTHMIHIMNGCFIGSSLGMGLLLRWRLTIPSFLVTNCPFDTQITTWIQAYVLTSMLWLLNHCCHHSLGFGIPKLVFLHQMPTFAHPSANMLRCHEVTQTMANSSIFEALPFHLAWALYHVGIIVWIRCCVCWCKKLEKNRRIKVQALVIRNGISQT